MSSMKRIAGLGLVFLAVSGRAGAQSACYLVPDRYELASAGEVAVHLARTGAGVLERVPWPSEGAEWLFVRSAGTQLNLDDARPRLASEDFVRLSLTETDVAVIGIDRRPWIEEVSAADLRKFLEAEVASGALPEGWRERIPGTRVRLRRIESSKVLVRSGSDGSATAVSRTGLRSEIRPLVDPTAIVPGSDLPLRVSWSDSAAGVAAILVQPPSNAVRRAVLSRDGAAWFRVDAPGPWLVAVHRAKVLDADPAADWEIESATLSFTVPPASQPAGGGK